MTPQAAPFPPSEGTGSTITSVVLQWTAPPLPLVLQDSPLIFILNYLFNGSNPGRSVILEVTNCAKVYILLFALTRCALLDNQCHSNGSPGKDSGDQ